MQTDASQVIGFTPGALWVFCGVAVALIVIAVLGMDLLLKYRELKKPKNHSEKTVDDKLRRDNERLTELETTSKRQDEELKLILRAQMDIIHHMADGNGIDGLRKTQKDIEKFLIYGQREE